jgi:predicted nucleic-acid-binding protein
LASSLAWCPPGEPPRPIPCSLCDTNSFQAIVGSERFDFDDRRRVARALELYQRGKGDLSDYLIGLGAFERGVSTIYTFDRALRDEEQFTLL